MKQNLLIVSFDYDLTRKISAKLADEFSMRIFDQRELFEFDHIPRTFSDVIKLNGKDYVLRKYRSILKMELDFDNALFVADNSFAENCFDLFYKIKLSNFVVFIYKDIKKEVEEIERKKYKNKYCEDFYKCDEMTLAKREYLIKNDCADICIDIESLNEDEIAEKVKNEMLKFYSEY